MVYSCVCEEGERKIAASLEVLEDLQEVNGDISILEAEYRDKVDYYSECERDEEYPFTLRFSDWKEWNSLKLEVLLS